MNSDFLLSQKLGGQLEDAIQRCEGTLEDIRFLLSGNNFKIVRMLREGRAMIVEADRERGDDALIPIAPRPIPWTVDDSGDIHFTLISNGLSPQQWEKRLECRGWKYLNFGRSILKCATEPATKGVTYNIVVRRGQNIKDGDRSIQQILEDAKQRGWTVPHWEIACLIRDGFTGRHLEEMGVSSILTLHRPIKVYTANIGYHRLSIFYTESDDYFNSVVDRADIQFDHTIGFALVEATVS